MKKMFWTNFNLNVIIVDVRMSINILKPCYILNSVIKNLLLAFRNVEHLLFKTWWSFIFWNFVKAVHSFVKYVRKTLRWINLLKVNKMKHWITIVNNFYSKKIIFYKKILKITNWNNEILKIKRSKFKSS